MYNHKSWKQKRKFILTRDKYLDQELLRYGKHVQADTVHHIFPLEFYPELKYTDWNLISLSQETHNRMHDRTSHNLTQLGIDLMWRHKRDYLRWCDKCGYQPHFEY